MNEVLKQTDCPDLKLFKRGKVRDIYDLGNNGLLMVATDRISAFDVVMNEAVPGKGKILNQISAFWFNKTAHIIRNHAIWVNFEDFPNEVQKYADQLKDRSMVVPKLEPLPIECIARGYISGSGWESYLKDGTVCGIKLPPSLKESDRLPETIFTPSTKAESGHDINISFEEMVEVLKDRILANFLKDISLKLYEFGREFAESRGIIIADTKFEFGFGLDKRKLIYVVDEILTPDSSRFWPADEYEPGGPQKSFDKQYLRDWLNSTGWDKTPPPPELPRDIIIKTRDKYLEAFKKLTGKKLN